MLLVLLVAASLLALAAAACSGGDDDDPDPTATGAPVATDVPQPTTGPAPTTSPDISGAEIAFDAASATITLDGNSTDWDAIEGATVTLKQFELPPGVTFSDLDWDEPNPVDPIDVVLKVAVDAENIHVLFEVPDDYDFDPADHGLTASPNIMFMIDPEAGAHMGTADDDFTASLGMVDIWHWEIECGPGELAGGGVPGDGNGACNLDDEFATDPEEREDDGGGDIANAAAETSLFGAWDHTGRAGGIGADGNWIFEFSRPLQTGDPQDAQFVSGGTALIALAYFDADETTDGWTAEGHLQSAGEGWIVVTLP